MIDKDRQAPALLYEVSSYRQGSANQSKLGFVNFTASYNASMMMMNMMMMTMVMISNDSKNPFIYIEKKRWILYNVCESIERIVLF